MSKTTFAVPARRGCVGLAVVILVPVLKPPLSAQVGGPLRINEVIADNSNVGPVDIGGGTPDIVEICNASDDEIVLGAASDEASFYLSNTLQFDPSTAWRFPVGRATILPRGYLVIFCDGSAESQNLEGECELHATFELSANGDEPITLWGPEVGGQRPVVDQVFLPPLPRNVSLCRFPDCSGPAPVPMGETLDFFDFCAVPTLGDCAVTGGTCPLGRRRTCLGGENNGTGESFRRGDANDSALVDLSDAVFVLNFLFLGGAVPSCRDAADADDNGTLELTDAVRILNYLFLGGVLPPAPGPITCGSDPTDDPLPACEATRC